MPYIAKDDRDALDPYIETLADAIVNRAHVAEHDAAFTGLLNYTATSLTLRVIRKRFGKMRYWIVAAITGTFTNVADEFYRRVGVPYEDEKIASSGDLPGFEEYVQEIEGSSRES